jgi:hypothetical protein
MSNRPNFIIIGAMKCATSTLHEQLALQSGIFMTDLKEPNFFSNDENYNQGIDQYLSLFSDANPNDLCGESSTHYTKFPTYPETVIRIKKHFPDLKFIYVMRHPINRLVSQYIHEWSQRVIKEDINQAIFNFSELIKYSLYTEQLAPYFTHFGTDKVLPIFFEQLLSNPQFELEKICQFIGYKSQPKWYFDLEAQNVYQERMIKSFWRDLLVEAPLLKQLRRLLIPKSFRNWVRSLWTMKKKPELTPENIEYLTKIFNEDLAKLGSWLDIDLNCDNFKEIVLVEQNFKFSLNQQR